MSLESDDAAGGDERGGGMPTRPPDFWRGTPVLVTGGAGFIGSHLVDALVSRGARVRALDNLQSGSRGNLASASPHIDLTIADLRDAEAVDRAVHGCEAIFHLGANASVPASVEDRAYDFSSNTIGSFHVVDAAVRHGVRRIIHASTAAVYGPPRYTPVDEDHPCDPISPYGGSKLAAERLLFSYSQVFDFELAIVRIFNTYGPRQPRYVAYDLIRKLARDPKRLEVLGSGDQRRDYCYVSDTVEALLLAGERASAPPLVLNVSGGRTVSIRELVDLILATLGLSGTEVIYGYPSWKGDIDVLSGSVERLRGLGWQPRVPLEEGLRRLAGSMTGSAEEEPV
jgi:UDP-glucose 4-epimerase